MPEPGVVLVGLPASGKTTVARVVASHLGRPLIDTDELLGHRLGTPAAAYLQEHGEPAFRRAEADAVAEACAQPGAVIATGGGAILDPLNRWALWHHGTVAWIDVEPFVLVGRLEADRIDRPTARPYSVERIGALMAERAPMYRAADVRLDGTGSPEEIAKAVLSVHGHTSASRRLFDAEVDRHHPLGPRKARVVMGLHLDLRADLSDPVAVVDRRLLTSDASLLDRIDASRHLALGAGERAKRFAQLQRVVEWLAANRVERGTTLVAVGGGTIGDLAGTAAAIYARGIPLAQVPTTWLAQADSAIGGKVAIDVRGGKNLAGAFWPPVLIAADVAALRSLPRRHRREGMAETVKTALIGDPTLWELIEDRGASALRDDEPARYAMVERSARLKLGVCDRDPYEAGERRTLNLGHTIGHALEVESRYRLSHGSAVALGLRAVASIAAGRGADAELAPRLGAMLDTLGFPRSRSFDPAVIRTAMGVDKKRSAGRQRWILPMEIAHVIEADDVTDAELSRALRTIAA